MKFADLRSIFSDQVRNFFIHTFHIHAKLYSQEYICMKRFNLTMIILMSLHFIANDQYTDRNIHWSQHIAYVRSTAPIVEAGILFMISAGPSHSTVHLQEQSIIFFIP